MKFFETKFEDYLNSCEKKNLHPELDKLQNIDKDTLFNNNIILYGPPGVGKYTQMLNYIKKFSQSKLKYERKMTINTNKKYPYTFKISDIHFEIDMDLLGCNARLLWNEIYKSILDILSSRTSHSGIIVCKNFHKIHNELLEIFYSYMQSLSHKNINITFIFISESVSFIPNNILNRCIVIPVKRPNKTLYKSITRKNIINSFEINKITNIKNIHSGNVELCNPNKKIVNTIIENIENYNNINYLEFRDDLYNIFIFHLDLNECIWEIIQYYVNTKKLNEDKLIKIVNYVYKFLKLYNNNYRPIYHLERFIFYLCRTVNEF
jgi:hypothetical protein